MPEISMKGRENSQHSWCYYRAGWGIPCDVHTVDKGSCGSQDSWVS